MTDTTSMAAGARARLSNLALLAAAGLSLPAAAIHVRVAPEHFAEWWGYGAFFAAAAAAELALLALLALRPSRWVLHAGIWGSVGTILMYLVSRTGGIPLGPAGGAVEEVELQGLLATAAEAGLVVLLCALLGAGARRRTLNALCLVGAVLWVAALAGVLSPAAGAAEEGHHHGDPAVEQVHEHHGTGGVPYIPEAIRNAPRPPGIG